MGAKGGPLPRGSLGPQGQPRAHKRLAEGASGSSGSNKVRTGPPYRVMRGEINGARFDRRLAPEVVVWAQLSALQQGRMQVAEAWMSGQAEEVRRDRGEIAALGSCRRKCNVAWVPRNARWLPSHGVPHGMTHVQKE